MHDAVGAAGIETTILSNFSIYKDYKNKFDAAYSDHGNSSPASTLKTEMDNDETKILGVNIGQKINKYGLTELYDRINNCLSESDSRLNNLFTDVETLVLSYQLLGLQRQTLI